MLLRNGHQEGETIHECKRDYEKLIGLAREELRKNQGLQDAIFEYFGNQRLFDRVAEMVGELVSESRNLKSVIKSYMIEYEKEQK